jgi:hypothetical protein
MVSEKRMQIATIAAMIAGSAFLSLILDSRNVVYALGVLTLAVSAIYGGLVIRGTLENYVAIKHAAASFFAWTFFAALFALSTLQVVNLWVTLLGGALLSALVGFLWPWQQHFERKTHWILLAALTFEWFLVLQFATANYMVIGALMTIAYTSTALLFEFQDEVIATRTVLIRHILTTIALAFIFILGFSWTL